MINSQSIERQGKIFRQSEMGKTPLLKSEQLGNSIGPLNVSTNRTTLMGSSHNDSTIKKYRLDNPTKPHFIEINNRLITTTSLSNR